jgi:plastocyanin
MCKNIALLLFSLVIVSAQAWAYEAVEVKDGGALRGKVKITGAIPADESFVPTKDKEHCGDILPREKYVISADGGVRYAVVMIQGITKGKAPSKEPVVIDNKKCRFTPHVQVAMVGETLGVHNSDPMLHNTHMYLNKMTVFNAALPITGMEIKRPIRQGGLWDVHCDAHTFMHGFMQVSDNPYLAVTDAEGNFSIKDIPAGTYKVKIWHEALGEQEKSVTIAPNKTEELAIDYQK